MNVTQLLEIVQKIFANWEQETKREENRKQKNEASLLAAAIVLSQGEGRPEGRPGLSYAPGVC